MDQFNFNLLSLNVRGLREYKKNRKIFNWIIKHGGDNGVTFLQETHSTSELENVWAKRTRSKLIMSHGTSKSKGTAILFGSKLGIKIKQCILDKNGRYVIALCELQGSNFLFINSYLPNYEHDQVTVMKEIVEVINQMDYPVETYICWGGDFNVSMNLDLESSGGNPTPKIKSIDTIETIMLEYDLCDIWRLRNPSVRRYTWRGKAQGKTNRINQTLHRRLDYFFISDELQPYVSDTDIIPAPTTDHSAITVNFKAFQADNRGPSFWKFNNSLVENESFCTQIKIHINDIKVLLDNEKITDPQLRWEYMKYEIRKFCMRFSKQIAKQRKSEYKEIEDKIEEIEKEDGWEKDENLTVKHDDLLKKLEEKSNYITEGIILRSKARWYEVGEKSNKYFLSLEKRNKAKTHIRKLVGKDNKEITDPSKILENVREYFSSIFQSKSDKTESECKSFLSNLDTPSLSNEERKACEKEITVTECYNALKQMGSSKTPGNDGITKELYMCLWQEIKDDLVMCLSQNFKVGSLSTTQKQIIITLLEKPGKDNRFIDAWRPISLINVDTKICSKVLSNRLINILPSLINPDQAAFVTGRNIDEPIRMISDIMEYIRDINESSLLFAADFEKAFDSIEHNFIYATLTHFGFGEKFIKWIKVLLSDNLSCITNNGKATDFFIVKRGTKQGDPISPYIFILVIEIMATMVRQCESIKGVNINGLEKKLVLFADDTTFFLKDTLSLTKVLEVLELFSNFSSLKLNKKKSEAGWMGKQILDISNQFKDIKWINFHQTGIKILGVYISYNNKFSYDNNFKRIITNFQTTLSIWKSRYLTLFGKIQILRSLAIPKLLYVCRFFPVHMDFIHLVENLTKDFVWNGKKPKIKHNTLIGDYSSGGLKFPDFQSTLKANQIRWAIRLIISSQNKTQIHVIPSEYCQPIGGFQHINANFDQDRIPENTPYFYKSILKAWAEISDQKVNDPTTVCRQYLWNNKHIKIGQKSIFYKEFSNCNINKVENLYDRNYDLTWAYVKSKGLKDKDYIKWAGIISAIPSSWKALVKGNKNGLKKDKDTKIYLDFMNKKLDLEKVKTNMIYQCLIDKKFRIPSSQQNIEKRINQENPLDWTKIYSRIYLTSIDTYSRYFQYKILNNILYLNRDLHRFKILGHSSCSFCSLYPETIDHIFVECIESKNFYFDIRNWLLKFDIFLPECNKLNIILGVDDTMLNYILLLYKMCLYKAREKRKIPNLIMFKNCLKHNEKIEYKLAKEKDVVPKHKNKWNKISIALK